MAGRDITSGGDFADPGSAKHADLRPGNGQPPTRSRVRIRVEGIVGGVGFQPYVYALATGLRLGGFVSNDDHSVIVEAEGEPGAVEEFVARVRVEAPPMAVIQRMTARAVRARGQRTFAIVSKDANAVPAALSVPADIATCRACLDEMADPTNRRYRYPFTSCMDCGPRYTIVRDVSFGDPITVGGYTSCVECAREYHDRT